jgi:hypothetical protein
MEIYSIEAARQRAKDYKPGFINSIIESISIGIEQSSEMGYNSYQTNKYSYVNYPDTEINWNNKLSDADLKQIKGAFTEAGYGVTTEKLGEAVTIKVTW